MQPPGLLSAPSLPLYPQVLDVPLTVKMRTGVQERVSLAHRLLPELRDWGVALVTVGVRGSVVPSWGHCGFPGLLFSVSLVPCCLPCPLSPLTPPPSFITAPPSPQLHGRSREQRYTRLADWPYIEQCAKVASPMPLFGRCPEPPGPLTLLERQGGCWVPGKSQDR